MKIYKVIILLLIINSIYACGLKSDVVPKGMLDLPYPDKIDYSINSNGVSIYNGSDNYTLYVEKADESIGFINLSSYKRVALINPKQVYVDEDVVNNRVYKYRFRNYHKIVRTYSPAVVRTIKYYSPIKHNLIKVTYDNNKLCVYTGLSSIIKRTEVTVNGDMLGEAKNGTNSCFDKIPHLSKTLIVTAIPYDKDNNTGIPYRQTITVNESKLNLPPQNIVVRRNKKDIVITWDKSKNIAQYKIYLIKNGKEVLIDKTDIGLFRYKADTNKCVDFKISALRKGKESKKVDISACE